MRHSCKFLAVAVTLIVAACASPPNTARFKIDFAKGVTAYEAGDYVRARKLWKPLATHYDLAALRNMGHLYRLGQGVKKNPKKAHYYYEKAAKLGHAPSQTNLAQMYFSNQYAASGLAYDNEKGMAWLEKAAAQGYPPAKQLLAMRSTKFEFLTR